MQVRIDQVPADYAEKIAVVHHIDKPLHALTVRDICKKAHISYAKFYRLFGSKEDIDIWFITTCFDLIQDDERGSYNWEERIVTLLELFEQEHTFFHMKHFTSEKEYFVHALPLVDSSRSRLRENMHKKGIEITPGLDVEIEVYSQMVPFLLRLWNESYKGLSIAEFAQMWVSCIPSALYAALYSE